MARRHNLRWRLAVLTVLSAAAALTAAEGEAETKKEKAAPTAKKLEKSFLLEARVPAYDTYTCPPPEVIYESCYLTDEYIEYRRRHSQSQFEHERHFRPVAGPPQPRPLPQPLPQPQPLPPRPLKPLKPTLVTFVAEEAHSARRDPWYEQRYHGGRGPPAAIPDWSGAAARDRDAWRERCYRLQRRDTRLENHILEVINSRELRDCEESCNRDRRCVSFNFRSDPVETVCELTDMDSYAAVAQFRPISGWDFYEKDASSYCSGWDNDYFDQHNFGYPYCSARVQDNSLLNVNAVRRDITARSLAECEQACRDERAFRCETFSFGVLPGGRAFSCHLTDLRVSELSPRDIEPAPSFEIYDFHGNGRECDRPNDQYDFRHGALETSSGRSCVRGPCRIDRSGGYWYCFTDVAEAVWDYCCDPDSQCQHDARMDMETCFVTQGRGLYRNAGLDTAWRPCSYRPGRYAYLTRNGTDHVVPDDTAANATDTANNSLLEPIDLTDERDKSRN